MPTIHKNQKCPFFDKVVLVMFCDLNGQVLNHCQEYGKSFIHEKYYARLEEQLKPSVCSKHSGLLSKGVVLQ
jgi:hypothetical protein